jgi:gentisate 1,2-dioxygenase
MTTTSQSHQEEMRALKELYDSVGLRGYWDIDRRTGGAPPIQPKIWRWRDIYPALQRAAAIVRLGEDTFRRANGMNTGSRTITAGFQYVAPGETAAAHRHTASALRFVVQGHGGYTTSDGEQMTMEPGDLLTQPNWTWHDHSNFSNEPMIWLDGLDAGLVRYLEANFHENWTEGEMQPVTKPSGDSQQRLIPVRSPSFGKITRRAPYHYRWADTLRALNAAAGSEAAARDTSPYDGYILEYTDPITGGHTFVTISCRIQMLLPGQTTRFHRHTSTTIYHGVAGAGMIRIDKENPVELSWGEKDTFILPPWRWHQHCNTSATQPAILFSESDLPVLEALDLYREEGD